MLKKKGMFHVVLFTCLIKVVAKFHSAEVSESFAILFHGAIISFTNPTSILFQTKSCGSTFPFTLCPIPETAVLVKEGADDPELL